MILGILAAYANAFQSALCNHVSVYQLSYYNSSAAVQKRPAGDSDYCNRTRGRSPKDTRWDFDDDTV